MILVLLAAGTGFGTWYLKQPLDKPPEYRTAPVARGELVQKVTASGQLNPVINVQVGSQISGIITNLYVDFNSPVKGGQVVAELDSATYKANVSQADGNLANAKASLLLANMNAKRAEQLVKDKLISQSEFDKAVADLAQAEAAVKISAASLEKAKVDLARCTIYAPIDGVVISRSVDVGQTVAASLSAPTLFVIANNLAKMQIDANVSEADVGGVHEGQDVEFSVDAFPGQIFHGKVQQVRYAPIVVQNVVTYDTVIAVSNDDLKLKPGMTANVSIIIARRENALRISNAALRFKPPEDEGGSGSTRWDKLMAKLNLKGDKKGTTVADAKSGPAGGKGAKGEKGDGGKSKSDAAPGSGGEGGGQMSEAERAAMRARMQARFGGEGGGGFGGGSGFRGGNRGGFGKRNRSDQSSSRTVYTLLTNKVDAAELVAAKPSPVQIKTGISDGVYSEVIDGLKEGDEIVIGLSLADSGKSNAQAPQGQSPFGGGRRRF
ncbi:MAG: efflux RND transporter periplasmic adaptor subunit [Pedosphaera parvula]|nr:efflux RND transporter periplasmic adaptor subunit [Pedosphaera parvula]